MNKNEWKNNSACQDFDTDLFFEKYEEKPELRPQIDDICSDCPVLRQCFAVGVSQKEWGVWGGIYLEGGKISREFNRHRTKEDWAKTWQNLTMGK
jgi:hypothetical protein